VAPDLMPNWNSLGSKLVGKLLGFANEFGFPWTLADTDDDQALSKVVQEPAIVQIVKIRQRIVVISVFIGEISGPLLDGIASREAECNVEHIGMLQDEVCGVVGAE